MKQFEKYLKAKIDINPTWNRIYQLYKELFVKKHTLWDMLAVVAMLLHGTIWFLNFGFA